MAEYIDKKYLDRKFQIDMMCSRGGTIFDTEKIINSLPTANVISIPEGATNGDMIKALFPNCEQKENIHNGYFEMYFDGDFGNPSYMRVREYWWNAPYKESEE